jgi:hypothetical protein
MPTKGGFVSVVPRSGWLLRQWCRLVKWVLHKDFFKDIYVKFIRWGQLIAGERVNPCKSTLEAVAAGEKARAQKQIARNT